LRVHPADDLEADREASDLLADLALHLFAQAERRQRAARIARMDAGLLDVLHDAADDDLAAVADRVDVDLDREVEEAVEQHGALVRYADGLRHVDRKSTRLNSSHVKISYAV